MNHSVTPWRADEQSCIVDAQGRPVAFIPHPDNHKMALTAVNAYAPMRAVIIELRDALENGRDAWAPVREAERLLSLFPHPSKI